MKVLHVIPSVAPQDGGPSAALRGMARALAAHGVDVTVATTDADGPKRLDVSLAGPVVEDGVVYRFFSRSLPVAWKPSLGLTRWLAGAVRDFDVLHVHALFSYTTIPACRFAQRARVPYVLRPLGTLGAWSLGNKEWKKRPYLALVEHHHLAHAAAIHATSEAEGEAVGNLGYGDRVHVIPLGVEMVQARPNRPLDLSAAVHLLFLSRLHPGKGIPLLLQAIAAVTSGGRSVTLTVAGRGTPEYERELRLTASRLGLANVVHFVGHVDGSEKEALLASADVFVLPSSHENFGIAIAEAMAAGLPVLVSDQVGLATDVTAARAGLVFALDVGALTAALESVIDRPADRLLMGARARELARSRYSWAAAASAITDLYETIVARSRVAHRGV